MTVPLASATMRPVISEWERLEPYLMLRPSHSVKTDSATAAYSEWDDELIGILPSFDENVLALAIKIKWDEMKILVNMRDVAEMNVVNERFGSLYIWQTFNDSLNRGAAWNHIEANLEHYVDDIAEAQSKQGDGKQDTMTDNFVLAWECEKLRAELRQLSDRAETLQC